MTDDTPNDAQTAPDGPEDPPDDWTPHEGMERYVDLAERERQVRREKDAALERVGDRLVAAVEEAAADTSVGVEVAGTSADGHHQTVRARLDRAALVAAVTRSLPDGFVVEHVNDDGTLTIEWDERDTVPDGRKYSAILKAIVGEVPSVPSDVPFRFDGVSPCMNANSPAIPTQNMSRNVVRYV